MDFFRYMSKKKNNADQSKVVDHSVKPQEIQVHEPQPIIETREEEDESLMPDWRDENEVRRAFIASEVFKRKY